MSQPVTLTNVQHAVLLTLQNHILPVYNFDQEDVEALRKARMIRELRDGQLGISGTGLDYLLAHPKPATVPERTLHEPAAQEQAAPTPVIAEVLSHYETEQLRKIANGLILAKHMHLPTRALLIKRNLIVKGDDGTLRLSEAGRDMVEWIAPLLAINAPEPPPLNVSWIETKALEDVEEPPINPPPLANGTRTFDEINALKAQWLAHPTWDIETTEGFEAHVDELRAYHEHMRAVGKRTEPPSSLDENIVQKRPEDCADDCAGCIHGRFLNYLYQSIPQARVVFERFAAYEHAAKAYDDARDVLAEATDILRTGAD